MDAFVKLAGLFVGLGVGAAPILSASWVWFQKQVLGKGGAGLLSAGSLILVISLAAFGDWQLVKVESEGGNWKLELEKATARIAELEQSLEQVNLQTAALKSEMSDSVKQVVSLAAAEIRPETEEVMHDLQSLQISFEESSEKFGRLEEAIQRVGFAQRAYVEWGLATYDGLTSRGVLSAADWRGWDEADLKGLQSQTEAAIGLLRDPKAPVAEE